MNGLVDEWIYPEIEGCREGWIDKCVDELCTQGRAYKETENEYMGGFRGGWMHAWIDAQVNIYKNECRCMHA